MRLFQKSSTSQNGTLLRFFLLLGVFAAYFAYLSWQYDVMTGGLLAALTWSFFVLCTPVADAGFLLDFPVRLITGVRMIHTEIGVWVLAITLNAGAMNAVPQYYDKTFITHLFHRILTTPWPYWGIIILCAAGTFTSIWLGDEAYDVAESKFRSRGLNVKTRTLVMVPIFGGIVLAYYFLLRSLGIDVSQITGS